MGVHDTGTDVPGSGLVQIGNAGLRCRGPLDAGPDATVFLGGSETLGRFVAHPFPMLLNGVHGPTANFGVAHGGVDCLLGLVGELGDSLRGRCFIVQLPCAANLTNSFFRVHPRRNDRLVAVTPALQRLFPEVDYSEFAFVRALLVALRDQNRTRFGRVREELRATWLRRMRLLVARLPGEVHLLWLVGHGPLGAEPAMITDEMVAALGRPFLRIVVDQAKLDTSGMIFAPQDIAAARHMPGPQQHREIARVVAGWMGECR